MDGAVADCAIGGSGRHCTDETGILAWEGVSQ